MLVSFAWSQHIYLTCFWLRVKLLVFSFVKVLATLCPLFVDAFIRMQVGRFSCLCVLPESQHLWSERDVGYMVASRDTSSRYHDYFMRCRLHIWSPRVLPSDVRRDYWARQECKRYACSFVVFRRVRPIRRALQLFYRCSWAYLLMTLSEPLNVNSYASRIPPHNNALWVALRGPPLVKRCWSGRRIWLIVKPPASRCLAGVVVVCVSMQPFRCLFNASLIILSTAQVLYPHWALRRSPICDLDAGSEMGRYEYESLHPVTRRQYVTHVCSGWYGSALCTNAGMQKFTDFETTFRDTSRVH